MAPEILNREHYKMPSDIYSFAISMLECFTWKEPFPKNELRFAWDIANFVCDGKRPKTIEYVDNDKIKDLIEKCWCQNPKERLIIYDVVALLESLIN